MNSNELKSMLSIPTVTGDLRMTRIFGVRSDSLPKTLKKIRENKSKDFEDAFVEVLMEINNYSLSCYTDANIYSAINEIKVFRNIVHSLYDDLITGHDIRLNNSISYFKPKNYRKISINAEIVKKLPNGKELNFSKFLSRTTILKSKYARYSKFLSKDFKEKDEKTFLSIYQTFYDDLLNHRDFIDEFYNKLVKFNNEIVIFMLLFDIKAFKVNKLKK